MATASTATVRIAKELARLRAPPLNPRPSSPSPPPLCPPFCLHQDGESRLAGLSKKAQGTPRKGPQLLARKEFKRAYNSECRRDAASAFKHWSATTCHTLEPLPTTTTASHHHCPTPVQPLYYPCSPLYHPCPTPAPTPSGRRATGTSVTCCGWSPRPAARRREARCHSTR